MTPATTDEQTQSASILPEIEGRLECGFACDPELKEELIAIRVGHAFLLYLSAARRSKKFTRGNLAFYAAWMTRSGRPVGSAINRYDVFTAKAGTYEHPLSLSNDDLAELLDERKGVWTPADHVAFRVDWQEFMSERDRRTNRSPACWRRGMVRLPR